MIRASIWRDGTPQPLTPEQEAQKREIYERMNPRRRKFIERIGYENWDPFQKPNEPLELRRDVTSRTTQQLIREFLQSLHGRPVSKEFSQGALESALGIINRDEKTLGRHAFCTWYNELLKREGYLQEEPEHPLMPEPPDANRA